VYPEYVKNATAMSAPATVDDIDGAGIEKLKDVKAIGKLGDSIKHCVIGVGNKIADAIAQLGQGMKDADT
jgi:hypothetical protein